LPQSPNLLLNALAPDVFAAVQPHLKTVELPFAVVVAEPGREVERVYFPHQGVISLVVEMSVGEMIETAMVGRDGAANATASLDGKVALHKGIVQVAGEASAIDPDVLRKLADDSHGFRSLIIRHEQVLLAQAQQSAGCNASHLVEARMCRWLLRMRDLAGSDDLTLTQEFLAQMLGLRRSSVSVVAGTLQEAGYIRYRRGHIRILDADALRSGACECYEAVRNHYSRLLGN
jgi:Crp-like helix-turn-helix domain